jgi:predicted Zn-dependent protease
MYRTILSRRRSPAVLGGSLLPIIIFCGWLAGAQAANEPLRLPQMGDPASAVLSPGQEALLGETVLIQIRSALPILKDPELNDYIQALGSHLVSAGSESIMPFTFLLVRDPTINAFAAPGGIVVVNTGMLLTAQRENELVGVMSHEIAHILQRHMARTYANAGSLSLKTALGALASILLGAYGGADMASAGLLSTMAANAQSQLAFSRANEQEADRVGLRLMAAARFDPQGMPNFFQRLQRWSQINVGPIPAFLSDHPITLSRIADTRSRAAQYSGSFIKNSLRFQFAKARVLALTSDPNTLISHYEEIKRAGQNNDTTDPYAYALALTQAGEPRRAIGVLKSIKQAPDSLLPIELALVQAYLSAGQARPALQHLQRLNEIYPGQESIIYYLAQAYIASRQPQKALSQLDVAARIDRHNPVLDRLKAEAAAKAGLPWVSHESLADYYSAYGQLGAALEQLELALNATRIDDVSRARIQSKRARLTELLRSQEPAAGQTPSPGGILPIGP